MVGNRIKWRKLVVLVACVLFFNGGHAQTMAEKLSMPIDRHALVARHNIEWNDLAA